MKRRTKVKINYFKLLRNLIILGIMIYLLITGISNLIQSIQPKEYIGDYTTYYVTKGDTLWSISEEMDSDLDIRQIIHLIREDNQISPNLQIGQELKLREVYE